MINEEVSSKAINLEVRLAKATAKELFKILKKLLQQAEKLGGFDKLIKAEGSQVKLKDMVKKGQLEELNVKDEELKELKKELNKHGVKFSVMKDKETGTHSVFFQAKDTKVMNKAFQNVLSSIEKRRKPKSPFIKILRNSRRWQKILLLKTKLKISKRSRAYE